MAETTLLAVSERDEPRLDELVEAAADVTAADGRVVVLHVFDGDAYDDLADRLNLGPEARARPDELAQRHAVAAEAVERLEARGVTVEVRGAIGDGGSEIVRVSDDVAADAVVVGGRTRSPSGKALFGSTAQHVLLEADAPVTFVKARAETGDEVADDRAAPDA